MRGLFLFGVRVFGDTYSASKFQFHAYFLIDVMENQNKKIANLQVLISENCSETEKEIIDYYWEFKENVNLHSSKQVIKKFDLRYTELHAIIAKHSKLSFDYLCEHCNKYELQIINNITRYNEITKAKRLRKDPLEFKCTHCTRLHEKKVIQEKKEAQKKLMQKLEEAIETKNWKNLNSFEREVLSNSLEMNFTEVSKKYWNNLGKESYYNFINALEKIAEENLIVPKRNRHDNYIYAYEFLSTLNDFKQEINPQKEASASSVQFDTETNELKFKLTINENQNHPDSPLYAGTVTFKERIVIEPGVEFIFGLWNRANENLYLTMTPLENLKCIAQTKRISKQPISLQQGITDFLNTMGKEF